MNRNRTDEAAHNAGTICKRETEKSIKYDKKCRMRKTVEPSPKNEPDGSGTPKIREMGFFYFPKFRITCIIRNNYNQKREAALLSFC